MSLRAAIRNSRRRAGYKRSNKEVDYRLPIVPALEAESFDQMLARGAEIARKREAESGIASVTSLDGDGDLTVTLDDPDMARTFDQARSLEE